MTDSGITYIFCNAESSVIRLYHIPYYANYLTKVALIVIHHHDGKYQDKDERVPDSAIRYLYD
jgi:hypothetical protein